MAAARQGGKEAVVALSRRRGRGARLGGPRRIAALFGEIQRLKADLLTAGGATIDTPDPPAAAGDAFPVAARTVVQPDGDFLFFVGDSYLADAGIRQLHADRVSAWFGDLERRVGAAAATLRRAALGLTAVVFVASGQAFRQSAAAGLWTLMIATGGGFVLQSGLRLAVGHGIRRPGRRR
ncbi:MAG TPA: hypothetical protein VHF24_04695 [Acidimicrobiales bacterium]|nr:hypothetical protein [Acidimicrobiales bacterium]